MVKDDPLTREIEPPESLLDSHLLFRGVHQILWKNWPDINIIQPNFYITKSAEEGLSVDWSKYATPQFTLNHLLIPNIRKKRLAQHCVSRGLKTKNRIENILTILYMGWLLGLVSS